MQLHNKVNRKVLKERLNESNQDRTTLSFYQYAHIDNPKQLRDELFVLWSKIDVYGRVYVAKEGINAQVSLPTHELDTFRSILDNYEYLQGIRLNIAIEDDGKSFYKLTIKVREKIVADGLNDDTFDVTDKGVHLDAVKFNELIDDPNTVLVDMRNHYESEVGHFKNAICPEVETFRASLPIIEEMLQEQKDKNLVMYCTGGIRCEKASAYYKHKGFEKVYQLEGGIIEYARQVEQKGLENKFIGKNFVFDERLGERISGEVIAKCHQCGEPCDTHINCSNDACHILFIQCETCAEKYEKCCSDKCKDFNQLSEEEQTKGKITEVFNGTHVSKNVYSKNLLSEHRD